MPKKKKLPPWLAVALAIILFMLLIIVAMTGSKSDKQAKAHPPRADAIYKAAPPDPGSAPAFESAPAVIPEIIPAPLPDPQSPPSPNMDADRGIALIMDDVGYDMHGLKRILNLSVPVAISILPGAPFASESASLAHRQNQIVMLHLPMEPTVPKYQQRMTDTFLRESMSDSELRQTFLNDLARIPFVQGVNNHMGSRLTQLARPMRLVMQLCREQGLFFVDSKTSSASVAAKLASGMGIAWASRRYFLDHQLDEQSMLQSWNSARACAERDQRCIVIAHPHKETIAFLEKHLTKDDMNFMLPLKRMLRSTAARVEQSQGGNIMEQHL